MYSDYYEPEYEYYDPEPTYYDSEPTYDNLEPIYDDLEPAYDDADTAPEPAYDDSHAACENELYDNASHVYGDFGYGLGEDTPSYDEEEEMDTGSRRTRRNTGTRNKVDMSAWASHYLRGPPSDVSPDVWYPHMETWRLEIQASLDAEASTRGEDDKRELDVDDVAASALYEPGTETPVVHVPWVADMLTHLHGARERGELLEDEYERNVEELQADELQEQALFAEGWVWDEERGDYWHPERGWGADDAEDELTDNVACPSSDNSYTAHFPDSLSAHPPTTFDVPSYPPFDLAFAVEPLVDLITSLVITASSTSPVPSSFVPAERPTPHRHGPPRYSFPQPAYSPRSRPPRAKHPSQPQRAERSSSVRLPPRNRHTARRRVCSCPEFNRDAPPHLPPLPTPPVPPDISDSPAVPVSETVIATVKEREPVPPDIRGIDLAAERRKNAMRRLAKKGKPT
ncbi:hypothetical protein FB45DRAFT_1041608 [Roridomyces roridus]|uniref:Uncharacterized protein n=1 Tax=Roridomyces roridus TaxID=1738132 RepID=A0AAD7AZV0_9AGAR|nr:hypothetical protein FB45DRAFT_1041608 [Roridomyces roridus]